MSGSAFMLLEHVVAVHVRHQHVEQHHVEALGTHEIQGLAGRPRPWSRGVPVRSRRPGEHQPGHGVVVDDQHGGAVAHARSSSRIRSSSPVTRSSSSSIRSTSSRRARRASRPSRPTRARDRGRRAGRRRSVAALDFSVCASRRTSSARRRCAAARRAFASGRARGRGTCSIRASDRGPAALAERGGEPADHRGVDGGFGGGRRRPASTRARAAESSSRRIGLVM